jgi:hypothetical protein
MARGGANRFAVSGYKKYVIGMKLAHITAQMIQNFHPMFSRPGRVTCTTA